MNNIAKRTAVVFALLLCMVIFFPQRQTTDIYSNVVRFHILANSDSDIDQNTKLAVRDALITYVSEMKFDNIEEACEYFSNSSDDLKNVADATLKSLGADYTSKVSLKNEIYNSRNYDTFCLPYGEYISLKVELGDAIGQNWWCVLFPPVCLDGAIFEDEMKTSGLTDNQIEVMTLRTGKPKIKFFIFELFERICKG